MALAEHSHLYLRSRHALLVVALSLVTGTGCWAQSPPPPGAAQSVNGIISEIQQKQFNKALEDIRLQLQKTPADYRLWTLRGMALSSLAKPTEALAAFDHSLKLSPSYLPALEGAAQIQYARGGAAAKPYLVKILNIRPQDPTTHAMLGVISYIEKDCDGAVTHFQKGGPVIAHEPVALSQYGTCLGALKRYSDAIPVLQQSLSLKPEQTDARYNLALCQRNIDQAGDALATLQPALDSGDKSERLLLLASTLYESTNQSQKAIDTLRQAMVDHPRDPAAYLEFAYLSYNHASPKVGIDFLNIGVTQLPKDARLYLVRGILYCQIGEFPKAMEDFHTANALDPRMSFVQVAMGIAQSQQHQSPEALAQFRAAVKQHPNDAFSQYLLAEAVSEQAKPDEQELLAAANRAITLDPKLTAAHDLLAGVYLQRGEKNLAISHSEAAVKLDPNDQQALYHLILALRDSPRKGEIPDLMKRLTELRRAESSKASDTRQRVFQFSEVPDSRAAPQQ